MYFTIAQTYKEKKEIINYYDNIRKQMEIIKEEFDEKQENEYNNKVIKRIKEYNNNILLENLNKEYQDLQKTQYEIWNNKKIDYYKLILNKINIINYYFR